MCVEGTLRVDIADDGVGIDPVALRRIFDPFYTPAPADRLGLRMWSESCALTTGPSTSKAPR